MAHLAYKSESTFERGEGLARFLGWFSIGLGATGFLAPRTVARMIGAPERPALFRLIGLREIAHGLGIFARRRPARAVGSRVLGDMLDLGLLGLAFASPEANRDRLILAATAILGVTALDSLCAEQLKHERAIRVQTITINRSPEELYQFWRNFENLPRFMHFFESVKIVDDKRSHWVARGPARFKVEWDSELTEDIPNKEIAWRSLRGSDIDNYGIVRFERAPSGRGTEVHVLVIYNPPAGRLGAGIARLFGRDPGQQLKGDLYRFKQLMETGEVVNSDSSIYRGPHPAQPPAADIKTIKGEGPQQFGLAA